MIGSLTVNIYLHFIILLSDLNELSLLVNKNGPYP